MGEQTKILLLEDDLNLGLIVEESLTKSGFAVKLVRDGRAGLEALQEQPFDLCLVDVMMPLMDGFTFAREARGNNSDIPLIFLTARSLIEDKVEGFRIGCDDYVTKPFSMEELILRIEAVLRRTGGVKGSGEMPEILTLGQYLYDCRDRTLALGENIRKLTDREADLLELLHLHKNRTLDRSLALVTIWGDDSYHCGRSMDVFVSRLRKYLDQDPEVEIRTVHGQGLRLLIP
jgi:two-component system, OmpR family, response regulator